MATTSTLRATLGALLGTVQTTAQTFTQTVNAVSHGVGMLDRYVTDASEKQVIDSKADQATYVQQVISRKSKEIADLGVDAVAYCKQSAEHLQFYTEAHDDMTFLLTGKRPAKQEAPTN